MPLRKLQEIIVYYSQYLYKAARNHARSFSIDYPYQGPVFDFTIEGDRLKLIDNSQVPLTLPDGKVVMENVNPGRLEIPERNKVRTAFFRFQQWQDRVLENRERASADTLEREHEIITVNMFPLAVKMLKYTAQSYSMPDPLADESRNSRTHPAFDLSCRSGTLESGDRVPSEIQLKVDGLNDLLREAERRAKRMRAAESHLDLSTSPQASKKIIRRLLQEIILDCADEMVLAGQRKTPDGNAQNQTVPIVRNGTDSLPITCTPASGATEIPKASSEEIRSSHRRRRGQRSSRKTKADQDEIAVERRKAVEAYIDEVFEKTGKRITKTAFWKAAGYKDRSEFERWQRNDPKTTIVADERFARVLREKPHLK